MSQDAHQILQEVPSRLELACIIFKTCEVPPGLTLIFMNKYATPFGLTSEYSHIQLDILFWVYVTALNEALTSEVQRLKLATAEIIGDSYTSNSLGPHIFQPHQ